MAMTIQLKGSSNPLLDLANKGGFGELGALLVEAGVEIALQPKSLTLTKGGVALATAQMNTEAFNLLLQDKLAAYSANTLSEKLKTVYEQAAQQINIVVPNTTTPGGYQTEPVNKKGPPKVKASDVINDEPMPKPAAGAETPVFDTGTAGEAMGLSKVKLFAATQLFQPVFGSDASSKYHVVALGDGIAVAARIKKSGSTWNLSVRAEGEKMSHNAPCFKAVDMGYHGNYASLHLNGDGGDQMAVRALGAILLGLGIPFKQMAAQAFAIIGKGA